MSTHLIVEQSQGTSIHFSKEYNSADRWWGGVDVITSNTLPTKNKINKAFRERPHPRPLAVSESNRWLLQIVIRSTKIYRMAVHGTITKYLGSEFHGGIHLEHICSKLQSIWINGSLVIAAQLKMRPDTGLDEIFFKSFQQINTKN